MTIQKTLLNIESQSAKQRQTMKSKTTIISLLLFSDLPKATPRDSAHPYVAIKVGPPASTPATSVTPSSEKKQTTFESDTHKMHVKYCT